MTEQETIEQLKRALANSEKELLAIKAKDSEVSEDDIKVCLVISKAETGVRHHELEERSGFSHEKVKLHLSRLMSKGMIAAHGGDKAPIRYLLDEAGRVFLDNKQLL